jgi:hypothetical protein
VAVVSRVTAAVRHALPAVLLALGAAACEPEPTRLLLPGAQTMVHGVLQAGADSGYVRVTRVTLDERHWSGIRVEPISGVHVEIRGAGAVVTLREVPFGPEPRCTIAGPGTNAPFDDRGCYGGGFPGGIRAGETYTLRAVLPGGAVVTGRTRVPLPPVLDAPADGLRVPAGRNESGAFVAHDTIPISYALAPGTAAVRTGATVRTGYRYGAYVPRAECRVAGSWQVRPAIAASRWGWRLSAAGCDAPDGTVPDSLVLRLSTTAYDSAVFAYLSAHGEEHVRHSTLAVGLTGAVGLFGASADAERRLVMVRTPPRTVVGAMSNGPDAPTPSDALPRPAP